MKKNEWKKILVGPNDSVEKVIEVINQGSLGTALVVDNDLKLLGVVTDGDIRRGLLRHISLSENVTKVMCRKPIVGKLGDDHERLILLMEDESIRCVPILDKLQRMVNLFSSPFFRRESNYSNWIFLMAGGFGKRLKSLTDDCPKPLLKIGERPILENIIQHCKRHRFQNFFVSLHYKTEMIKDYFGNGDSMGVTIKYIEENEPLGTGGALGLLPEMTEPLIVMNGDLLTKVNFGYLLQFHEETQADVTMCVREYGLQVPYGTIQLEGHIVKKIVEKPSYQFFINAGIYVLSPDIVNQINGQKNFDIPILFNRLIQERKSIVTFPIHEYWLDMGRIEDFKQAQIDILNFAE